MCTATCPLELLSMSVEWFFGVGPLYLYKMRSPVQDFYTDTVGRPLFAIDKSSNEHVVVHIKKSDLAV